jgi:hypothetical protein
VPVFRILLALLLVGSTSLLTASDDDAAATAALVGRYVEHYFARAHHLLADEEVVLQPLSPSMDFAGLPRRVRYELRLEWAPEADDDVGRARVMRERIGAGGARLGPPGNRDCFDPKAVSPEPLGFMLPEQQKDFTFSSGGTARLDGRDVVRLDYRPRERQDPTIRWEGECGQVSLAGGMRGHLWVDPDTGEVLRWDERLIGVADVPGRDAAGRFDPRYWMTIERVDTTTRYEPIRFADPEETLLLPVLVENTTIVRNSGMPRLRITRTFSNYRRFLTESRLLMAAW